MFYAQKHLSHKTVAATGHSAPVFPEFEAGRITTLAKNKFLLFDMDTVSAYRDTTNNFKVSFHKSPYWQKVLLTRISSRRAIKIWNCRKNSAVIWSSLVKQHRLVKMWILPFLFLDVGIAVTVWVHLFPVLFCSSILVSIVLPCTSSLCPFPPFSFFLLFHL